MQILLNGTPTEVPNGLTIASLILHLGYAGPVAVERNREVVPRAEHGSTELAVGDQVEIVHFVGGG
ncbi:MAG: sulfur carrier protein ThiS [Polyangiales bacterium]